MNPPKFVKLAVVTDALIESGHGGDLASLVGICEHARATGYGYIPVEGLSFHILIKNEADSLAAVTRVRQWFTQRYPLHRADLLRAEIH